MSIISLSLDDKTNTKIDEIMKEAAYDNRSELVRKAVSDLHAETVKEFSDNANSALMVIKHPHSSEHKVSELLHSQDDIIQTQLHSKIDSDNCLEILLVEGESSEIQTLREDLKGSKATERVELISF